MRKYTYSLLFLLATTTCFADRTPSNLSDIPTNPNQGIIDALGKLNDNMLSLPTQIAGGMAQGFGIKAAQQVF